MNRTRTADAATCRWPRASALRSWAGTRAAYISCSRWCSVAW